MQKRTVFTIFASALLTAASLGVVGQSVARADPSDPNWSTYQHDSQRTGVDPGQAKVASVSAGWTSAALDGQVYAQPLVVANHVLVATEGNTVYSLNAVDGSVAWQKNLGPAVSSSNFPCGNINPIGITGTPVVDATNGAVYAIALLSTPNVHHELFSLNLGDGSIIWHQTVDAPGADPVVHNQRGALALSQGRIYVAFGGRAGDCGNYNGRVVSVLADGTGGLVSYTVPTTREGGIWTPSGPTVDPSGDIFVATGNGASTTTYDHSESVIRLSPTLAELDLFAPSNWAALNAGDVDIGSVGPAVLGNNRVFQVGKAGVGYLLAANALGGIGGQLFSSSVCAAAFGGLAHQGSFIYVPCTNGLKTVKVAADGNSFSAAWSGPSGFAGPPIVSGGLVWTLYRSGVLYALDAGDGHIVFQTTVTNIANFSAPSSGAGQVFVAANGGIISFRLTPKPPFDDFDGDGKSDVAVFRPSTGTWYIQDSGGGTTVTSWGASGDIAVPGDYNGDGKTDIAVFRPSTGVWYILNSGGGTTATSWGASGDIAVPGDYNGDGKTDIAVFRPSTGVWYILNSGGGTTATSWGTSGDIPAPGDYNGDGKTDIAVFRPSTGTWFIQNSGAGGTTITTWGTSGDIPAPGDYNGDGKADIAVFRPSTGTWFIQNSGAGGTTITTWGATGDNAVPGDFNGDGKADVAVFRPSTGTWYIQNSGGGTTITTWGASGDTPIGRPPGS